MRNVKAKQHTRDEDDAQHNDEDDVEDDAQHNNAQLHDVHFVPIHNPQLNHLLHALPFAPPNSLSLDLFHVAFLLFIPHCPTSCSPFF